jgi:MFS transporter, DHA1 family, inner membrane transport protein
MSLRNDHQGFSTRAIHHGYDPQDGRLVDRYAAVALLGACLAIAAINQVLMGFSLHAPWTIAMALAIWSITGWGTFAPQQARLIDLAPDSSALLIALNHSIIYIGAAGGAVLGGLALAHGLALDGLHWITAALLLAALLTLIMGAVGGRPDRCSTTPYASS